MTAIGTYVIALTGGSGSGKSTLADALISRLSEISAVQFREDRYYWPMSRYGAPKTETERAELVDKIDYDDPINKETALMARQLADLKMGKPIAQPIYDYDRHDRVSDRADTLKPAKIIIVEGIHALSIPEIEPLIDLSIYVDTPDDLRLARRLRRDVIDRGRSVESVLSQYLGTVRAAHYRHTYPAMFKADLVIADEGLPAYGQVRASEEALDRMIAPILDRLRSDGVLSRS